jgi:hypothetical protein
MMLVCLALSSPVIGGPAMAQDAPGPTALAAAVARLPKLTAQLAAPVGADWLVEPTRRKAGVYRGDNPTQVVMTNGLIRREWRLSPGGACVSFDNLMTGESLLRAVSPEAKLSIDGKPQTIGGLVGQPDYAYLRREWVDAMKPDPGAWTCTGFDVGKPVARFGWKRVRYSAEMPWPPPGASLALRFEPGDAALRGLVATVHYEMYDGIPLICKWVSLTNGTGREVRVTSFVSEVLAAVEHQSGMGKAEGWQHPAMHVEADMAFCGAAPGTATSVAHWVDDPRYTTQVNYEYQTPCLLECRPPLGPDAGVAPGETFETFRVFELVHDSFDRERRGLAQRRMYRTVAPWVTENPILMHVTDSSPDAVKRAIDQCAEAGFEMLILSFGSGFDIENETPEYVARIKALVDYGKAKGVELGGYSLLASRRIDDENDVLNPKTGKPGGAIFGNSPCLGSRWGREYFRKLRAFIERTGLCLLEHDGSYPGDPCASTKHPGHRGLEDSQWTQWRTITDFYHWCRERGTYLNVPDWYFLSGSNKTGMGYRETNWSLPREMQILLGRQNLYDGTWDKTPSMGWMFVPLTEYQGGGAAATLEPLKEHLDAYERHLVQNFGAGVQACYRGPRLFDGPETRSVVQRWVRFYKDHRAILDSDIVHVRRPDGRDLDAILHVNPSLKTRGLAMVYNPLLQAVKKSIVLPLYYTGLKDTARIRVGGGRFRRYKLDRVYRVRVDVNLPAGGFTWIEIEG